MGGGVMLPPSNINQINFLNYGYYQGKKLRRADECDLRRAPCTTINQLILTIMTYELRPVDGRKSFYGKAIVETCGGYETLYSYRTPIATKRPDGSIKKLWDGWTATTGRHIMAFCGLNKKQFMSLPM